MYYNIYSNISNADFLEVRKRLVKLENRMSNILFIEGWSLTERVERNDALIVDFIFDDGAFMGNIGLTYIDEPREPLFTFYVAKSYDELEKRYFVRDHLSANKKLIHYEQNIGQVVSEALTLYKQWTENYIIQHYIND